MSATRRFRWGYRLFMLGCGIMLLTAIAHLTAHFAGDAPPANDTEKQLLELTHTYEFEILGSRRTYAGLMSGYSVYYSASLIMLAFIGWNIAGYGRVVPPLLLSLALSYAASSLLFAVIAGFCWVKPPLVMHLAAMAVFLIAAGFADPGMGGGSRVTLERSHEQR